jgi:importin subunit beta-1
MQLVPVIMQKLNHTLEMAVLSSDDREKQSELQALLCGVLQASAKPVLMISNGCSQ